MSSSRRVLTQVLRQCLAFVLLDVREDDLGSSTTAEARSLANARRPCR